MKTLIPIAIACSFSASSLANAEVYSHPSGYTTTVCPPNSDTIVGLPLRIAPTYAAALSSSPEVNPASQDFSGSAVLTTTSAVPGGVAGTHYLKFKNGSSAGLIFPVISSNSTTLTVDLQGANFSAVQGNMFEVIKFWTLDELFDPSVSTSNPATTGNAIVASTNRIGSGRQTEILLPSMSGVGTNLSSSATYFIEEGVGWKMVGGGVNDFGHIQLWPDTYFTIRHPVALASSTNYIALGQVELEQVSIPLATRIEGKQDSFVALVRPVEVTLDQLNLKNTNSFVSSENRVGSGRRDELLLFDNTTAARRKSTAITYYVEGGEWRRVGAGADNVGSQIIPISSGFIIRKHQTANGVTAIWNNTASYSMSN